jgi:hypothetical protein
LKSLGFLVVLAEKIAPEILTDLACGLTADSFESLDWSDCWAWRRMFSAAGCRMPPNRADE